MFYCNLLSGPSLLAASFTFEDWSRANLEETLFFFSYSAYSSWSRKSLSGPLLAIVLSGLATVAVACCTAWCLRVTSSTTYTFSSSQISADG